MTAVWPDTRSFDFTCQLPSERAAPERVHIAPTRSPPVKSETIQVRLRNVGRPVKRKKEGTSATWRIDTGFCQWV